MDSPRRSKRSIHPTTLALCIVSAVAAAVLVKMPLLGIIGLVTLGPKVVRTILEQDWSPIGVPEADRLESTLRAPAGPSGFRHPAEVPDTTACPRIRQVVGSFAKTRAVVLNTHELSAQRRTDILAALSRARAEAVRVLEQQRAVEEALRDGVLVDRESLDALEELTRISDRRRRLFVAECARIRASLAALTLDSCEGDALGDLAAEAAGIEPACPPTMN
jgi:hypothetical protein